MYSLVAASAFFLLIHFGVSGTRLGDVLVARIGAGPYRGAFALASLAGLVWMSSAYGRATTVDLWGQLTNLRPIAFVLVLVAFLFVGIGLTTPSPTQVGMESKLAQGADIVHGIVRRNWDRRHPNVPIVVDDIGLAQPVFLVCRSSENDCITTPSSGLCLIGINSVEAQLDT